MCNIFIISMQNVQKNVMQYYKYNSTILSIQPICRYTPYSVACIRVCFWSTTGVTTTGGKTTGVREIRIYCM